MFDVTIYDKSGYRNMFTRVLQITNISDNIVIDLIDRYGNQHSRTLNKDNIEYIKMGVMK